MNYIKRLFIKQEKYVPIKRKDNNIQDLKDNLTGDITKSSLFYNNSNRLLKLQNNDCAIVMHPKGKIEIIFTKLYDKDNQNITPEEQTLMSIAIFLQKPGFAELLRHEFHQIAMRNINELIEEDKQKGK